MSHWNVDATQDYDDSEANDSRFIPREIYAILLFVIVYIYTFFDYIFPIYSVSLDKESLIISLLQVEASSLALVITLSLIAVQLAATSYSPRVIDIFKRFPDIRIILSIYFLSIVYDLAVIFALDIIIKSEQGILIYMAIFFSIYAFVILAPYTWNLIVLLKPDSIIYELSKNIKIENFGSSKYVGDEYDPLQPITDILINSLIRYDAATSAVGMRALKSKFLHILIFEKKNTSEKKRAIKYFVNHLTTLGLIALKNNNHFINNISLSLDELCSKDSELSDHISLYAIRALGEIGEIAAEEGFVDANKAASLVAKRLGELGKKSVEKNYGRYVDASLVAAYSLGTIGEIASQRGTYKSNIVSLASVDSLEEIGNSATEIIPIAAQPASATIRALVRIGKIEIGNGSEQSNQTAQRIIKIIGNIGKMAAEMGRECKNQTSYDAAESLKALALISTKKRLGKPDQLTNYTIMHLEIIGTIASNYQALNKLPLYLVVESYLEDIGFNSLKLNFGMKNEASYNATKSIKKIALNVIKNNPEKCKIILFKTTDYFRLIGRESISKDFGKTDQVSGEAIRSMNTIMKACHGCDFSQKNNIINNIINALIELCFISIQKKYIRRNEVAFLAAKILIDAALYAKNNGNVELSANISTGITPLIQLAKKRGINDLVIEFQKINIVKIMT